MATIFAVLAFGALQQACAQSDDFNDGNDTTPVSWKRYDAISTVFGVSPQDTWTFPGGNSYRLQANPSPGPFSVGPARVSSFPSNVYSDFYASVDLVSWDDTYSQAIGFLARAGNFGTPGSPSTRGYLFFYANGAASSGVYDNFIAIARMQNDAQSRGVPGSTGDTAELHGITLDPANQYRLVFLGKGTHLEGRVYQLPNLSVPIAVVSGNTAGEPIQHTDGQCGLLAFNVADVYGNLFNGPVDVTYDNYQAATDPPLLSVSRPSLTLGLDSSYGLTVVSWPAGLDGIWILERSESMLPGALWTEVTADQISFSAGQRVYSEDPGASASAAAYFRLRKL